MSLQSTVFLRLNFLFLDSLSTGLLLFKGRRVLQYEQCMHVSNSAHHQNQTNLLAAKLYSPYIIRLPMVLQFVPLFISLSLSVFSSPSSQIKAFLTFSFSQPPPTPACKIHLMPFLPFFPISGTGTMGASVQITLISSTIFI